MYHLDCCSYPDHFPHYGEDGCGHRWQCRNCHMWWTPQEYKLGMEHDEALDRQERELFERGLQELNDNDYETAFFPDEVYP